MEAPRGEEGVTQVLDRALDLPFSLAERRAAARSGSAADLEQGRVIADVLAVALE
ncbi:hypothetical protein [Sandaracinus amylolyticus]|uniref:hypothetical protein n=1 Tax=Sandaracinus amylolyticus TaxID=927083 RepID=UPI003AF36EC8